MVKGILISFFCLCLFLSHIFIFHFFKIKRRFLTMVKIFFMGLLVYIFLFFIIFEDSPQMFIMSFMSLALFAFLNGAFLQLSFFYLLLYTVQAIGRSPSTQIMIEIENSPAKKLTLEQIKEVYSIDRTICNELEDMVVLGRLSRESEDYIITAKGRRHTQIFKFVRDYLKLRRS